MNSSWTSSLPEWLECIPDGDFPEDSRTALNECLRSHPSAQDAYLKHLLFTGTLEQALGAPPVLDLAVLQSSADDVVRTLSAPQQTEIVRPALARGAGWSLAAVATVLSLAMLLAWRAPVGDVIPLMNSGFEKNVDLNFAATPNNWYGDFANIVSRSSGVSPLEGGRMLRFVKSAIEPQNGCEVYQIIDLSSLARDTFSRPVMVEASAYFNSATEKSSPARGVYGIAMYACAENPAEQPLAWPRSWNQELAFSSASASADADEKSWQQLRTKIPLDPAVNYLILQLSVSNDSADDVGTEFEGHFVDDVKVQLAISMKGNSPVSH